MAQTIQKWFRMIFMVVLIVALPVVAGAALDRTYTQGNFLLELDGVIVGPLKSIEGGMPTSDVVLEKLGPDSVQRKHLAGIKYGEITVMFGAGMTKPMYQWMQDTLAGKHPRKNGAIVYTDFNSIEIKRLTFANALISEIGFPELDGASKNQALFTLKISPEYTRPEKGKGGKVTATFGKQEALIPTNFRLTMAGLDMTKVSKVEALVVKQKVQLDGIGDSRDYAKLPAALEIPNLVIEMSEAGVQSTADWFNDFVVKGSNGQDKEKSATIELLDPSLRTVLMTINLNNLGIFKLESLKTLANTEAVAKVRASMYCETMQFNFSGK